MTSEQQTQATEVQGAEQPAEQPAGGFPAPEGSVPEQPADWAAFITDEGEPAEEPPKEPQAEEPEEPAAEAQSEPEPEGEPAESAQEPEPPSEPPAQDTQPQPQAQEPAELAEPAEQPDWEKLRQEALQQLREEYRLDEEAARRFEADPAATLPELAAQLHVRVYDAVFASIQQMIPQMVEAVLAQRERVQSFEQRFFERWPQLREHKATVERFLQAYRMAVPTASEDELIRNVGAQAVIALQLPIEAKQQEPAQQAPAPEPSPQAVGRERKGARPAPTVPTPPPQPQQTGNIWEELIHEE